MEKPKPEFGFWAGPYLAHVGGVKDWHWVAYDRRDIDLNIPNPTRCFWIVPGTLEL